MSRTNGAALPRTERLREPREFERLFRCGARLEQASFVLLWVGAPGPRAVGFAVGRRLGGSVVRNRARRRLREAYRLQKGVVPVEGVRLCIVARRVALRAPFDHLFSEMGGALRYAARRLAV